MIGIIFNWLHLQKGLRASVNPSFGKNSCNSFEPPTELVNFQNEMSTACETDVLMSCEGIYLIRRAQTDTMGGEAGDNCLGRGAESLRLQDWTWSWWATHRERSSSSASSSGCRFSFGNGTCLDTRSTPRITKRTPLPDGLTTRCGQMNQPHADLKKKRLLNRIKTKINLYNKTIFKWLFQSIFGQN